MSFQDVLKRGDEFLEEYPRTNPLWNYASHATCLFMITGSKIILNTLYKPFVHNIEKLDNALAKARLENRGLLTVMNHMSVVDDPAFYAALPWRYHLDIDTIRWGFGAHNICFSNVFQSWFFNLGKILGTKRFGEGPFQGSLDAAIRILSPDDTLDLEYAPGIKEESKPIVLQTVNNVYDKSNTDLVKFIKPTPDSTNVLMSKSPFIRTKTSWFHVFPEGFVLQLQEPHNNSMRYFKWGVSRLILESTRAPVVVPIFTYGFEKVAPEDTAEEGIKRWLPANVGAEIHLTIGDAISDQKIEQYRQEWRKLVAKYIDKSNPTDLSEELKNGDKAQDLRSSLAAYLRDNVLQIRDTIPLLKPEDPRFKDPKFWKIYTNTEGMSNEDVKFVGKNWAIRRFQSHLPEYEDDSK
ncbi:Taz1 protein [Candida orthopsilosis Co 90-125]|uniref:Tafazzin family protein n=1 Tax=Candida orthopsilosis (strain 90-125) TaxID=1136231 RepID=H8X462_CANO9|nr:Taz1 protein [Candida orthopsilosis Co 90-125]CCG26014.1 Taz1 protein [Candida orthopsilosis Co 90-125]